MSATVLLVWAMRLACWPFEVEGQGQPPSPPAPGGSISALPTSSPASLPVSLPLNHQAHYDIRYGVLGSVGALSFSVGGVADGPDGIRVVKVEGTGAGAVFGLGRLQRRMEAEFDPSALESRRWTIVRQRDGQTEQQGIRDTGVRGGGGAVHLERIQNGKPAARHTVQFTIPTSDPLGLLWRVRTAPPAPGQTDTVHLMDGLALWRVRLTTGRSREILPEGNRTAIRLDGEISPIFYDGAADASRPTRRFTLWLNDATDHLPLRLEVPVGLGDVVITLTGVHSSALGPIGPLPVDGGGEQTRSQLTGPVPGARSL